MDVCCECCVLSGRGLCDEPITRPEESYRLWCVVVCDQETSKMRRPWPAWGHSTTGKKNKNSFLLEAESTLGHSAAGRIMSMKNFNDSIGNRTHDLPVCSAVTQQTAPPRASILIKMIWIESNSVITPWKPTGLMLWVIVRGRVSVDHPCCARYKY